MPNPLAVVQHYQHGSLLSAIAEGIERMGKTRDTVGVTDLAAVDEFHIGGRSATKELLEQLDLDAGHHLLDVGCGLGGTSRLALSEYGCRVTGIDLTAEYVDTGRALCEWVGLADRISPDQGNATALPYQANVFDRACMLHVGMNIADKAGLMAELYRVVRPGGRVGVYDVMQITDSDIQFPVPWATTAAESQVASPEAYRAALTQAGFRVVGERNRTEFAAAFFAELQARVAGAAGPPPLGLHLVMGATAPQKVRNMINAVSSGIVAPVEIVAEKAAT